MSVALTENGECNGRSHGLVYGYSWMVGLTGVIHPIIVRRRHDGNRTVSVVLEQFPGRLSGLGRILVCNMVRVNRVYNKYYLPSAFTLWPPELAIFFSLSLSLPFMLFHPKVGNCNQVPLAFFHFSCTINCFIDYYYYYYYYYHS